MGRSALLVCAVLALLVATGCGGDDDADDIAAEGNEICRELNAKAERIGTPRRRSELAAHSRELRVIYEQALGEFRALDPPEEDEQKLDEFLLTLEELVEVLYEREGIDEFTRAELARNVDRFEGLLTTYVERADALGLDQCAPES